MRLTHRSPGPETCMLTVRVSVSAESQAHLKRPVCTQQPRTQHPDAANAVARSAQVSRIPGRTVLTTSSACSSLSPGVPAHTLGTRLATWWAGRSRFAKSLVGGQGLGVNTVSPLPEASHCARERITVAVVQNRPFSTRTRRHRGSHLAGTPMSVLRWRNSSSELREPQARKHPTAHRAAGDRNITTVDKTGASEKDRPGCPDVQFQQAGYSFQHVDIKLHPPAVIPSASACTSCSDNRELVPAGHGYTQRSVGGPLSRSTKQTPIRISTSDPSPQCL